MKTYRLGPLLWSAGLVLVGLLLLLLNLGILAAYRTLAESLLAFGCAVAGVVVFVAYSQIPQNWWRLILAWTLWSVALTLFLSTYLGADRPLLAAALLSGLTFAFVHVYWIDRHDNWWSMIPAGFLFVVGVVSALNIWITSTSILGAILIAGLGLVFILLYLLQDKRHFWWALIPGGTLLTVALVTLTSDLEPSNFLLRSWPVLLIVAGLVVGWRASKPLPESQLEINQAPKLRGKKSSGKSTSPYGGLGDYTQAAPGTTIDILTERD